MIWLMSRVYLILVVMGSLSNGELHLKSFETNSKFGFVSSQSTAFAQGNFAADEIESHNPCKHIGRIRPSSTLTYSTERTDYTTQWTKSEAISTTPYYTTGWPSMETTYSTPISTTPDYSTTRPPRGTSPPTEIPTGSTSTSDTGPISTTPYYTTGWPSMETTYSTPISTAPDFSTTLPPRGTSPPTEIPTGSTSTSATGPISTTPYYTTGWPSMETTYSTPISTAPDFSTTLPPRGTSPPTEIPTGSTSTSATAPTSWIPYKDEKCVRAFKSKVGSYDKARAFCKKEYGADLISIDFKDKQVFLENYLKTYNIKDNVWLGLRRLRNGTYVWLDGSVFAYSNWIPDNPKNNSKLCVQMHARAFFGKWSDTYCERDNTVICEIIQPWSQNYLQKMVINNRKKNAIPAGFIYVQLPKEKSPKDIWPWMTWKDVSSDYEDVFFRVQGKNSSSFGTIQQPDSPRITDVKFAWDYIANGTMSRSSKLIANNQFSSPVLTAHEPHGNRTYYAGLQFKTSASEVRPLNMAIRIWKLIK